jgi:hypothetical protein
MITYKERKLAMRISNEYIYDRHWSAAEDELSWDAGLLRPASILLERSRKGKFVTVKDDEFALIDELVSGAWFYEGYSQDDGEDDPNAKILERTANRIRARWEKQYYERKGK